MQIVDRGWLVYQMTNSPLALGLVSATFGVPILLFSMFGGAIADRLDKRQILIVTHIFLGAVTLMIAILISTGSIQFWHLMTAAFLTGLSFVFHGPTRQAIIPELVERGKLLNAISLNSTGMNLTRVVAPSIAGVLVSFIDISGVYYILVGRYVLAVAALYKISKERMVAPAYMRKGSSLAGGKISPPRLVTFLPSIWADLKEGLSYMRHSPITLSLMAMAFVPLTFGLPYINLIPVFADDVFHMGPEGLGFLMAAAGVGALGGSLVIASLGDFRRKGTLLLTLALGFGLTLGFFGLSHNFGLSLVILVAVGAGGTGYMAVNNTLIQSNTPQEVLGRVMSIYMITFALMPLGTLPISAIAEAIGVGMAVAVGGAIIFIFTLAMIILRPSLRRLE
jgi:MFS family permease